MHVENSMNLVFPWFPAWLTNYNLIKKPVRACRVIEHRRVERIRLDLPWRQTHGKKCMSESKQELWWEFESSEEHSSEVLFKGSLSSGLSFVLGIYFVSVIPPKILWEKQQDSCSSKMVPWTPIWGQFETQLWSLDQILYVKLLDFFLMVMMWFLREKLHCSEATLL